MFSALPALFLFQQPSGFVDKVRRFGWFSFYTAYTPTSLPPHISTFLLYTLTSLHPYIYTFHSLRLSLPVQPSSFLRLKRYLSVPCPFTLFLSFKLFYLVFSFFLWLYVDLYGVFIPCPVYLPYSLTKKHRLPSNQCFSYLSFILASLYYP